MANKLISDLTAATTLADTDVYEIDDGAASLKVTGAQIKAFVAASVSIASLGFQAPSAESASRALVAADNSKSLISTGSLTFTVNTGMPSGFGVLVRSTSVTTFAAGGGVTLTDLRNTTIGVAWATLVQTGINTYDIVGTKI